MLVGATPELETARGCDHGSAHFGRTSDGRRTTCCFPPTGSASARRMVSTCPMPTPTRLQRRGSPTSMSPRSSGSRSSSRRQRQCWHKRTNDPRWPLLCYAINSAESTQRLEPGDRARRPGPRLRQRPLPVSGELVPDRFPFCSAIENDGVQILLRHRLVASISRIPAAEGTNKGVSQGRPVQEGTREQNLETISYVFE